VNHSFMIYLPLLCKRPEVLQGSALSCSRWLMLLGQCTRTL